MGTVKLYSPAAIRVLWYWDSAMNIYEVGGFVRLAFEARRELSAVFMTVKIENKS